MSAFTPAKSITITNLTIEGMSCGSCANHVTEALESVSGVSSVEVNVRKGTATVRHDGEASVASMVDAVESAGYGAQED